MRQAEISGISPFFIVSDVPSALSFYRDRLGFEITFQGPEPEDIFFGIVRRGGAQILLKDISSDRIASTDAVSETSSSGAVGAPFGNGTTCRIRCLIGNT